MRGSAGSRRRRARGYAQAIARAAQRDDGWDAWEADLEIVGAIASDERIRTFLESPAIAREARLELLDRAAGERLGARGRGLLQLLIDRRDLALARAIGQLFLHVADAERRLDRVQVTTAVELQPDEATELESALTEPGRTLRLTTTVDPAVVGGVVIRRGDNLLDLSVRAKLRALAGAVR